MRKSVRMTENNVKLRNMYLRLRGGILDFKGISMEPTIRDGAQVKVEPAETENIKIGDIIVFDRDILVCHRVLGRFRKNGRAYFWEKGDNSNAVGYTSEDDIIGKAVYLIEEGKTKELDSYFNRKNMVLLRLLEAAMYPYIKTAALIKRYMFSGRDNLISHVLGAVVRRAHYFCFGLITKKDISR